MLLYSTGTLYCTRIVLLVVQYRCTVGRVPSTVLYGTVFRIESFDESWTDGSQICIGIPYCLPFRNNAGNCEQNGAKCCEGVKIPRLVAGLPLNNRGGTHFAFAWFNSTRTCYPPPLVLYVDLYLDRKCM